jgi:hypothetical protein
VSGLCYIGYLSNDPLLGELGGGGEGEGEGEGELTCMRDTYWDGTGGEGKRTVTYFYEEYVVVKL